MRVLRVGLTAMLIMSGLGKGWAEDLRVGEKIELLGSRIYREVVVEPTGVLTLDDTLDPKWAGRLELIANRVEVRPEAKVSASSARGNLPKILETNGSAAPGGGYGGRGGGPSEVMFNPSYGDAESPTIERGTYGTAGGGIIHPGRPGGALVIRADNIMIDGLIESNGQNGSNWRNDYNLPEPQRYYGGGGGSGGGILIIARRLTIGPQAKITANGGDGGKGRGSSCWEGYPGSGGRIKIFYETGTISELAVIEAKSGTRPEFAPGACGGNGGATDGTIHIEKVKSVDQLLNPGDLNGDGKTDHEDLFLLLQHWKKEIIPIPTAVE